MLRGERSQSSNQKAQQDSKWTSCEGRAPCHCVFSKQTLSNRGKEEELPQGRLLEPRARLPCTRFLAVPRASPGRQDPLGITSPSPVGPRSHLQPATGTRAALCCLPWGHPAPACGLALSLQTPLVLHVPHHTHLHAFPPLPPASCPQHHAQCRCQRSTGTAPRPPVAQPRDQAMASALFLCPSASPQPAQSQRSTGPGSSGRCAACCPVLSVSSPAVAANPRTAEGNLLVVA